MLPFDAARRMRNATADRGDLGMAHHAEDDMYVITKFQDGGAGATLPIEAGAGQERLRRRQRDTYRGSWQRASVDAQVTHYTLSRRAQVAISTDSFTALFPKVRRPRSTEHLLVVAHCPQAPELPEPQVLREFAGWHVTAEQAVAVDLVVEPETHGLAQLDGHWPVRALAGAAVLVVSVGSLGSTAAAALAAYGVGRLDLLDPDRLLWHNTVRHVLDDRDIGRHKTDALAERLAARWPGLDVRSHVADVVGNADLVRGLLPQVDAVLCAADGIAPRRVVSHLARRARRDAVLASVLEDGALGEVLRLRPAPDQGCLLCRRHELYETARMEPERAQERGYGDGDPHRPMTAVGPDIALVGALAAKVTVASVLERRGYGDQRLPGEQAVVGLRLRVPYKEPFDAAATGDVRWNPATPPRPNCVTCTPP